MNASTQLWTRLTKGTFFPSQVEVYKSDATRIWIKQGGKVVSVPRHNEGWDFFPTATEARSFIEAKVAEIVADATDALNSLGA